jgi:hypothetical protein
MRRAVIRALADEERVSDRIDDRGVSFRHINDRAVASRHGDDRRSAPPATPPTTP